MSRQKTTVTVISMSEAFRLPESSNPLDVIRSKKRKADILELCGENPVADGIECPHCGALETFKNRQNPEDTTKWAFVIRAFRIDDASECRNCGKWFTL